MNDSNEEEVKRIQARLNEQLLQVFESNRLELNDDTSRHRIKQQILSVLHDAVARGDLASPPNQRMPVVDVNNREELEYVDKQIALLESQRDDDAMSSLASDGSDSIDTINKHLWRLRIRRNSIIETNDKREPTMIDIALKDPDTFEPVMLETPWGIKYGSFGMGGG